MTLESPIAPYCGLPRPYRVPLKIDVWPRRTGPFHSINFIASDVPAYLLVIKVPIPLLQQKNPVDLVNHTLIQ